MALARTEERAKNLVPGGAQLFGEGCPHVNHGGARWERVTKCRNGERLDASPLQVSA